MSKYITGFSTTDGIKKYDYNALANKPESSADSIKAVASGEVISTSNAVNRGLASCKIYGKTIQNGVPTPTAPVEMVSLAENGNISIAVCGKNLFSGWAVGGVHPETGADYAVTSQRRTDYLPISAPGQKYSISGIPNTLYTLVVFYDINKNYISRTAASPYGTRLVEPPVNAKYFRLSIYENEDVPGTIAEADAMAGATMIEASSTVTTYEKGKPVQYAAVSVSEGLRGIPVASGGNYIDADGQAWVCDEIDFGRGVYVQRVTTGTVNSVSEQVNESSTIMTVYTPIVGWNSASELGLLTNIASPNARAGTDRNTTPNVCRFNAYGTTIIFDISRADYPALADFNAHIAENPIKVAYILATPIETPLSEEELYNYASLRTHNQATTISNDGWAHMELEYIMDAKKYIDSLVGGNSHTTGTILPAAVE